MTDLTTMPATGAIAVLDDAYAPHVIEGALATADVRSWLERAEMYQRLSRMLVRSHFIPAAYKVQVSPRASREEIEDAYAVAEANATGAMMLGGSLGLDPLTSLQQIYVIHGRPGMYAKIMVALVQAAGHDVWDEEYTPERAVVCGRRKGWDESRVVRIEITMDDAKRAGWTSNSSYAKTPADMLWARAAGRVCDRIASDVLRGIRVIEDITPDEAPAAAARVTVSDIRGRGYQATEPGQTAITAAPVETVEADHPSDAQMRALHASFRDAGISDRADRLKYASGIADRDLSSSSDLTAAEASRVIDALKADQETKARTQPTEDELAAAYEAEQQGGAR